MSSKNSILCSRSDIYRIYRPLLYPVLHKATRVEHRLDSVHLTSAVYTVITQPPCGNCREAIVAIPRVVASTDTRRLACSPYSRLSRTTLHWLRFDARLRKHDSGSQNILEDRPALVYMTSILYNSITYGSRTLRFAFEMINHDTHCPIDCMNGAKTHEMVVFLRAMNSRNWH